MEEFRFLLFRFPDERSDEFFDALDVSLPEGWWREHETEKRMRDAKSDVGKFYCYGCGKSSAHGAAALIVSRLDAQNYAVANLLPREPGMLDVRAIQCRSDGVSPTRSPKDQNRRTGFFRASLWTTCKLNDGGTLPVLTLTGPGQNTSRAYLQLQYQGFELPLAVLEPAKAHWLSRRKDDPRA